MNNKVVKVITVMSVMVTLAFGLTGCGKKVECDVCGETAKCTEYSTFGETINMCDDCYDELKNEFAQ